MKICIIGGGTAGWWTAAYLEKFVDCSVTIYESDTIQKLSVGESTLPQVKYFFDSLGIDEHEWMDNTNAVYKYGNIKLGWDGTDYPWTFSFWQDIEDFDELKAEYTNRQIHDFIQHQDHYPVAFHFDAHKAGQIVQDMCNAEHRTEELNELPEGFDLYIDCTGFQRKFIEDKSMVLTDHNINKAWVCHGDLQEDDQPNFTISTALKHGWEFQIALQDRVGLGYCFDGDEQECAKEFLDRHTHRIISEVNLLKWTPGVLKSPWQNNVVAIGTSSGFIDPLESTSLFMVQYSITNLANCINRNYKKESYNRSMLRVWSNVYNYIKCHYELAKEQGTDEWHKYSKILWENYSSKRNPNTNLLPSPMWAQLALYYDNFEYYQTR